VPSSELYLRASAFSVFCPIMQFHSDYNARRKPSRDRTPWNIQERSGDPHVIPTFRKLVNLRMNLIPYIMEQAKYSSQTGLPLMRTLALEYPHDPACKQHPYQYFFGNAMLVAPIMEEECSTLEVYLPRGEWSDLWTGERFHGGKSIQVDVPMEHIPVFQRAGSVVALNLGDDLKLCSVVGNSTESIQHLAAIVFPGEDCESELYQGNKYGWAHIKVLNAGNGLVDIEMEGLELAADLFILGDKPSKISMDGDALIYAEDGRECPFWNWLPERRSVHIHVPAALKRLTLQIVLR
jgi:alpha-glucosidase (family GH31 glycosyl hydrolase)